MKAPDGSGLGRLARPIPKGMQTTLLSVGLCTGLIFGYYCFAQKEPLPADAHVSFRSQADDFSVDLMGNGNVIYQARGHAWGYHVSPFAVRRVLRVFKRQRFFERDVTAYRIDANAPVCELTLWGNHQKSAIRYVCGLNRPELAKPLEALNEATHYRDLVSHFASAAPKLKLRPYAASANGPVN